MLMMFLFISMLVSKLSMLMPVMMALMDELILKVVQPQTKIPNYPFEVSIIVVKIPTLSSTLSTH